ncbi:MAG TPA: glycosyltransferase family 2 protein [Thermoanaerobaculales bacterium]|nr:glycosyltransferase family 2 protein [Thermoanaerobaculales bacterium]HPA82165.1 glycosyltransferase family 2 protein [Thermoanaerobaculales bacterium]HQL28568.1 glycosyltransferase family 2 protein [Thermoanaerobaculales bacterium]HQN95796.1 glycosyltransferase family 2 protein [Thermoanaerobaculales bacterium]
MTRLSVVIPAFNEAVRLPPTLREVAGYLAGVPGWLPAELIVVDDGSLDGTADAAGSLAAPAGIALTVVSHERNRGKGAAVRTGFLRSGGEEILLSDADLASPIDQLAVLASSGTRQSVRIGSRALDRSLISIRQPSYRDLMGRIFNLAVRALVLPGIHDTQCGFKLFPGQLGRSLARAQRIDGFAFDVELLFLARRWGAPIVEVPVRWRHVEASRVQPLLHSAEMLRDLLWLRLRAAAGRLGPRRPRSDPGGGHHD